MFNYINMFLVGWSDFSIYSSIDFVNCLNAISPDCNLVPYISWIDCKCCLFNYSDFVHVKFFFTVCAGYI